MCGNAKFKTCFSYFVFKQISEGLENLLKINIVGKSANVMMRLDDSGFSAETRFNNVGINCSLSKEIDCSDLLCFFLKYSYELSADNLTLMLRLRFAGKFYVKSVLCIYSYKVKIEDSVFAEYGFDFITLLRRRP